jgi:DNA polymerase III alpha subunit
MIKDKFGQHIYSEDEILDIIMQGIDISKTTILSADASSVENIVHYCEPDLSLEEFDLTNQKNWFMPKKYKELDIAEYILSLCNTQHELQRCGQELLMYQDRNLFNLLRYLKYLVDTLKENNVIWGVGRGSSVSSYVLYKLEVHKVDSMFYNLDVSEFLR